MLTQLKKQSFVRWLLFLLIILIASWALVFFLRPIPLAEAIESEQVVLRGLAKPNEGLSFPGPMLQVERSNPTLWPLIVTVPQGLTLMSDESHVDVALLKTERVLIWSEPRQLFAFTLEYNNIWPNTEAEYKLTSAEITPDLSGLLLCIDSLGAEGEYAAQIAVWMTRHASFDDLLKELPEEAHPSESARDRISSIQQPCTNRLLLLTVGIVALLILIAGIYVCLPSPKSSHERLINHLSDWKMLALGGMAEVWLAYDDRQEPPRQFVVKYPKKVKEPQKEQNIAYRFSTEGKLHQRLQHKNIVKVIETGSCQHHHSKHHTRYLIQTFIDGCTIKALREQQPDKRLPQPIIFELISQLLDALEYIHHQEVVHRDITWNNVMVDKIGQLYLIDFGIATEFGSNTRLQSGFPALGTTPFYAPSSLELEDADPARDFYALAVLLYAMYGGELPLDQTAQKARELIIEKLEMLDHIPDWCKDVLLACLDGECGTVSEVRKGLRHQLAEMVRQQAEWKEKRHSDDFASGGEDERTTDSIA